MKFNKFAERVKETLKLKEKAEKETGEKKLYLANVTAECMEMLSRAEFVKDLGGESIMVDICTTGFSALQTLCNENRKNFKLILHAHRAMHAAFTRNPKHGISMLVLAKLCRLIGLDEIHVGAIVGKMVGKAKEVYMIGEEIEKQIIKEDIAAHVLKEEWFDIKPMFAVCSGGLHPGKVEKLMKIMGHDIIIQMGGGIHGHPKGTIAGAKAARQAVDAVMQGISLKEYARTHAELRDAIKKWGVL